MVFSTENGARSVLDQKITGLLILRKLFVAIVAALNMTYKPYQISSTFKMNLEADRNRK